MIDESWLASVPIWSPTHVLRRLAEYSNRLKLQREQRLEVALTLSNGSTLRGRVARFGHQGEIPVVLLTTGEPEPSGLMWVDLREVCSVEAKLGETLRDVLALPDELMQDKRGPAPTKLALQRKADQILPIKVIIDWDTIQAEQESVRQTLEDLLGHLEQVLTSLAGDAVGKEALGRNSSLRIVGEESARAKVEKRSATEIGVAQDFRKPLGPQFNTQLQQALERVL